MVSDDGRHVLTFNGEIYNFIEVRADLETLGHRFHSRSDTEVLLHALMEWGTLAVHRLTGMFAFAFWDDETGKLTLVRDRLGIKPLYYCTIPGELAFGSELTPILGSEIVQPLLDRQALESYLRLLWIPDPSTLFANIVKLPPGCMLTWDGEHTTVQRYWDIPAPELREISPEEHGEIRESLTEAVRMQLRSDVPVGAFLSGGLDSSAIVALAAAQRRDKVRTYSIGFSTIDRAREAAQDDLKYARRVAKHLGTEHHEIVLSPDVISLMPKVVRHLEDPIADPAAINCYLISQAARETSTVLLSGTGADELFGGYRKYRASLMAAKYRKLPDLIRRGIVEPVVAALPVAVGARGIRSTRFAKKFFEYASAEARDCFLGYSTYYNAAELEELLGRDPREEVDPFVGIHTLRDAWDGRDTGQVVDRMTYVDLKYYLPGLGLAYMDKASMAASVEVRVPLLDDPLVDLISRLPDRTKIQGHRTKAILRDAVADIVPEEVLHRPKAPFAAPIRAWLRKDLAPLVDEYLSPGRVSSRGLLNPGVVHRLVTEHRRGAEDHSLRIWALITLESWIQEFIEGRDRYRFSNYEPSALGEAVAGGTP